MLTADQLSAFKDIHRRTFDNFDYVHDIEKWKTPEYWLSEQDVIAAREIVLAGGRYSGDCEDLALIERPECRLAGIPTRLLFCWVPQARGYHIGLVDAWGKHFADCNHPHLVDADLFPYEPISLSGLKKGEDWHYVKGFDHTKPWPHLRVA